MRGGKRYIILSFRVPTTYVGQGVRQQGGSKGCVILSFRVPTTSVGARGEVVGGSKGQWGARGNGVRGVRGMLY